MKDSVILEGKIYISAKRAAKVLDYAQDYIGQLCRAGKLDCKMIGRSWFVTEESLLAHREVAADATQERVLKAIKNNDVVIKETIQTTIAQEKRVSPVPSTIVVPAPSTFKYEVENKSALPELRKRLPSHFALPKIIANLHHTPFATPKVSGTAIATSSANPIATALVLALLVVSGFSFTISVAKFGGNVFPNLSQLASPLAQIRPEVIKQDVVEEPKTLPAETIDFNGIGVMPSTGTEEGDNAAIEKIKNSFSDEVVVIPDQSGTAGIVRPIFKKAKGNDFIYVLVPLEEQKK